MEYSFGDILDARGVSDINHFILVVGENNTKEKNEVMYYIITSRIYRVFDNILTFFNLCLKGRNRDFANTFGKEKHKDVIRPDGPLSHTIFLDNKKDYGTCFDIPSMVVINSDPEIADKEILENQREEKMVIYKDKITNLDSLKLIHTIKDSNNVSPFIKRKVSACFGKK